MRHRVDLQRAVGFVLATWHKPELYSAALHGPELAQGEHAGLKRPNLVSEHETPKRQRQERRLTVRVWARHDSRTRNGSEPPCTAGGMDVAVMQSAKAVDLAAAA